MHVAVRSTAFTLLLGLLAALPALSIDISAPTLLLLPAALHSTTFMAGLTLSLFMAGFALGQFVGGTVSDRRGRRPVLLAGLALFSAAALACAAATSAQVLVACRLVQGTGAGTCSVLAFAMVQDAFEGDEARSKRAYVTFVLTLAPLLAPAFGSGLTTWLGWRSVHGVMAVAGGALLVVCWLAVAETRRRADPAGSRRRIVPDHSTSWFERRFIGAAIANAFSYGCIFAYIAGSPIVIMGRMGLHSAVFAAVFASTAAALSAGAWTGGWLSRRGYSALTVLGPSLALSALAASAVAIASLANAPPGPWLLPSLLIVLFARGVSGPNLQHVAVERKRDRAGAAAAAVGILQLSSGALASAVVAGLLPLFGTAAVATPMAVLSVSALLVWWWSNTAGPSPVAGPQAAGD